MNVGDQVGRWHLVRYGPHDQRRGTTRSRWTCRCACGHTQPVWQEDLVAGRSRGCRSPKCRARFEGLLAALDAAIPARALRRIRAANEQGPLLPRARLPAGYAVGRWLVVRSSHPVQVGQRTRPGAVVECLCGTTRVRDEHVLKLGRSLGCERADCRAEWLAYELVHRRLTAAIRGEPTDDG